MHNPDSELNAPSEVVRPSPVNLRIPLSRVWVIYAIIAVNVFVFLLSMLMPALLDSLGLRPGEVIVYREWWRLLTAGFVHANIFHIASNLYALYALGLRVERFFGSWRFLGIYIVALLGSSVLVVLLMPLYSLTVGASGAVLGTLGALLVYFWRYREKLTGAKIYLRQLVNVAILNLVIGFLPQVSLLGHLGGFLAGASIAWALLPRYSWVSTPRVHLEKQALSTRDIIRAVLIVVVWIALLLLRL